MNRINPISKLSETKTIKFVNDIARWWVLQRYGPVYKRDKTNGFYLSCIEDSQKSQDYHVHLVGNLGKYNPLKWSVKERGTRRVWYKIDFSSNPRDEATYIYVKSGFYKNKKCKK